MSLRQLQNIVENGLLMRINGGGSNSPTRSKHTTTEAEIVKKLQGGIADTMTDYYYVLSDIQLMFLMLMFLMLIPKNQITN